MGGVRHAEIGHTQPGEAAGTDLTAGRWGTVGHLGFAANLELPQQSIHVTGPCWVLESNGNQVQPQPGHLLTMLPWASLLTLLLVHKWEKQSLSLWMVVKGCHGRGPLEEEPALTYVCFFCCSWGLLFHDLPLAGTRIWRGCWPVLLPGNNICSGYVHPGGH